MHPIFVELGPLKIHWYGVMMALAFSAGLINWVLLGKREGRKAEDCSDLLFWVMVSGIIGARLAHVGSNLSYFISAPHKIFYLHEGGLIYYGGFVGSAVGLVIYARKHKERFLRLTDFVITAVPLGHIFGRIGCFLNGCCFGLPWDHPLGYVFPFKSQPWYHQCRIEGLIDPWDKTALPVYPVQLLEAGINLVIYLVLIWLYRRRKRDGDVVGLYLLTYPVARFCLEFLRGDDRMKILGASVAQWVSVGLFLMGWVFLWTAWKQAKKRTL